MIYALDWNIYCDVRDGAFRETSETLTSTSTLNEELPVSMKGLLDSFIIPFNQIYILSYVSLSIIIINLCLCYLLFILLSNLIN